MSWLIEKLVGFYHSARTILFEGWDRMPSGDRAVFAIAAIVELFALVFTSGIMYQGAVFALSMMISLGLLIVMIPPLLRFLVRWRVAIDFTVTISLLVLGFLSGSVLLATSLMFFGLCLSSGLRLGKACEHLIPAGKFSFKELKNSLTPKD
jgi:hypothetical protein